MKPNYFQHYILLALLILLLQSARCQEYIWLNGAEAFAKTVIVKAKNPLQFKSSKAQSTIPAEIYQLAASISSKQIRQVFPHKSITVCKKCVDLSNIYEITYEADIPLEKVIAYFAKLSSVEYAEARYISTPFSSLPEDEIQKIILNDPYFLKQYELQITRADLAWSIDSGSPAITIGVTDTGFDIAHEDLVDKIAYNTEDPINSIDDDLDGYVDNFRGWDFGSNDNNPSPENNEGNHGTTVAGFAAAENNNKKGIASAGYKCTFLPIKIANSQNAITRGYEGIVYAADHGCQIINCSWGNTIKSRFGQDVVNYATYNKNALVVAAAGNSGNDVPLYPASYETVLGVAGTDHLDQRWGGIKPSGSSFGHTVNISAPGTNMTTTGANSSYTPAYGGTSFAAPIVSSIAGLVRHRFPEMSALEVAEQLKANSDNIDTVPMNLSYTKQLGFGRINAYKALQDTSKASVYLKNITITDKNDSIFLSGDTLWFSGDFVNFLNSATDINVSMDIISFYLKGGKTSFLLPFIGKKETVHADELFSIILPPSIPLDFEATVRFNFTGENCYGYQYHTITVNKSDAHLKTDNSALKIYSDGVIGKHFFSSNSLNSLTYKGDNALFDAGFMIGLNSNSLLSSFRNNKDFIIKKRIAATKEEIIEQAYQNIFSDTILPGIDFFGIDIIQNTYIAADKDAYIIEYGVYNRGNILLDNLRAGIFADWEVMHAYLNEEKYNKNEKLAYVFSNEPGTYFCGLSVISDQKALHHVIDAHFPDNDDIILNDGFDKEEKFLALSTNKEYIQQNILGTDISHVMSISNFNVHPGDTSWFAFGILLAESEHGIIKKNQEIKTIYQKIKGTYKEEVPNSIKKSDFGLYLNYQKTTKTIEILNISGEEWETDLTIFDNKGATVLKQKTLIEEISTTIDVSELSPNVYNVVFSDKEHRIRTFRFIKN